MGRLVLAAWPVSYFQDKRGSTSFPKIHVKSWDLALSPGLFSGEKKKISSSIRHPKYETLAAQGPRAFLLPEPQ
ncbi:hypothetical protein KM043_009287 [Ampulex compressa]|nr:hypothetical protein KM043_009287 [Ampulex compressa]